MGEPTVASVRSKWVILVVIVIAVAFGFAIASWTGVFFPFEQRDSHPEKVEKIYFDSCQWSEASSSGDIAEVHLAIMNTGPLN